MTNFYSRPTPSRPDPSLRVSASAGIDEAERTVVLAYRSGSAPTVLETAVKSAAQEDAALRVVLFAHDKTTGPTTGPEYIDEVKALSRPIIDAGLEFEIQRAADDVAEQVLDLAREHGAALIVLATRRRSPVMKLFLGSSAQRIILEADCPVLTLK